MRTYSIHFRTAFLYVDDLSSAARVRARAIVAFEDPKSSRFERRVGAVVWPSRREGRDVGRAF